MKLQREIDVRKGKFNPLNRDSWFDLETKETNGNTTVVRLKADKKMYDQWKTKLENAFKMKEEKDSDGDSEWIKEMMRHNVDDSYSLQIIPHQNQPALGEQGRLP